MHKSKVILIIIAGRRKNLEILIPHIMRARQHFDYCELWMNAVWEKSDAEYIRALPSNYPGTFVLKDDGAWRVAGKFEHYVRYYKTLANDDTLYVKLDDDILWMERDAIKDLIDVRQNSQVPIIVIGNVVNNAFCNVEHQKLGLYPKELELTTSCYDKTAHLSSEFAELVHRTFLKQLLRNLSASEYQFPTRLAPMGRRTPNHVFAFYGKDILWRRDDEAEIGTISGLERRPILIAGKPIFLHYGYDGQTKFLDTTDIRATYVDYTPGKHYSDS